MRIENVKPDGETKIKKQWVEYEKQSELKRQEKETKK